MRKVVVTGVVLLSVVGAICISQVASAHVLNKSNDNAKAAILHIIPDDDPIAGEPASLLFDTQGELLEGDTSVSLVVQNNSISTSASVATKVDGSLVSAKYVFPTQGTYTIKYVVATNERQFMFEQTMRVSRGIENGVTSSINHGWAEALLLGSGALTLTLGIIGYNRRKDIFKSSVL